MCIEVHVDTRSISRNFLLICGGSSAQPFQKKKNTLPSLCSVPSLAIYDNLGAVPFGWQRSTPIHFIDSKWICDSSSNGFVIMALGFLPPSSGGMRAESVRWRHYERWRQDAGWWLATFHAIFQPLLSRHLWLLVWWCDGTWLAGWVGRQGWLALRVVEALAHFNSFNARVTPGRAVAALPQRWLRLSGVVAQIPISATIDTWRKQAPPPFLLYFSFLTHSFTFRQSVSLTLKLERQRTLWQGWLRSKATRAPTHGLRLLKDASSRDIIGQTWDMGKDVFD